MQQDVGQLEDCIARFADVLRAHQGRLTSERRQLVEVLCGFGGEHFLPEDVTSRAAQKGHRLATTTVYRNLPLLIEAGILRRAPDHGKSERAATRYELVWNRDHHDHLFCTRCGREVEFHSPAIEVLQDAIAREHGFVLEGHRHELVGICPDCQPRSLPRQ